MSRLTVLQSLQTILETEFSRVYVYPDEYGNMADEPAVPYFAIEELPAKENNTMPVGGFADLLGIEWTIALYGYMAVDEMPAPGADDAAAKALAYTARDTIRTLLQANTKLSGTLAIMGDDRRMYTDMVVPLQWNQRPYYGLYFEIPVISG